MSLKSLVLCSDEKIVRVLRRTLGDLEIGVELCSDAEGALRKLTRQRFEAIIVDCADPGSAEVLRSARAALCNKRAVAVAIVEPATGLRSVFDTGAHFVLYKPVSSERAKSSFRAARALMKRERRRNFRIPVQIPMVIKNPQSDATLKVTTTDLSEGGMAVRVPRGKRPTGRWEVSFTLPGTEIALALAAEFAWEGTAAQAGLRFVDMSPQAAQQLRSWLQQNSPEAEQDDPPVRCHLTDLSMGGCYLEISSPFPVATRVTLSMSAGSVELRAEGVVRVMHPDKGMGVEFTQTTPHHRDALEKFLSVLTENRNLLPELLVEPEGLESGSGASSESTGGSSEFDDPLLGLFRSQAALPADTFFEELRKQRSVAVSATASV
ncbi:MAG: PilZ domain-containing protein [Acidobacteriia bacterium]|nr:PilZ domain-containing protein [Terriglobia bacterium]